MLEPEVFDWIAAGPTGRLLLRRVPGAARPRQAALRRAGQGLLGGRRHARGVPAGPQGRARRAVQVEVAGFQMADGVWLGEGAEVHPEATVVGPAVVGDELPRRRRRSPRASTSCSAPACACEPTRPGAGGHPRQLLPGGGRPPPRGRRRAGLRPARRRALRGGRRCSATSASSASTRVIAAGVKVYPFKTVEAGAIINSSIVWESRGLAVAVRADRRGRAGQRRHHPRAGHPPGHGLRHHPQEGRRRSSSPATRAARPAC